MAFKKYDIVSRGGLDEQIVVELSDICMDVICIKGEEVHRVGEEEHNLQRRYDYVRHGCAGDIPNVQDAEFTEVLT